ncbi:MAG: beta-galactosidase, partial [Muribaculaceae bacterium]|nr:beta-galactosidase [Muribaculaceae bacterium]
VNVSIEIAGNKRNTEVEIPANTKGYKIKETINVPDAKPWSPDSPDLYDADIILSENGKEIDSHIQKVGFRTIEWDAENGFKLNGKNLLLNGGCIHHDNGILGAAAYKDAERRRVRLMKEAGFNAVRTSHNIPSEAFLDACDEYGLLVIDEPFDGWRDAKNDHDYHELFDNHWKEDIDAMLLRDRNHPSIFCWSIGNEVIERKKLEVVTTAHKLASRCRELDPTRPVTSALASWDSDWEIYDPLAAEHDIVGYNYMIHKSESDHERVPSRVMMQTESYPNDAWSNYRKSADNPYIIGDFVWTAMDYIGESGIGRHYYEGDVEGEHFHRPLYPWHASHCGDI